MKWKTHNNTHSCAPYSIFPSSNGEYEVWLQDDGKFGVLRRGLSTLNTAKAYVEQHKVKQPV